MRSRIDGVVAKHYSFAGAITGATSVVQVLQVHSAGAWGTDTDDKHCE